MSYKREIPRLNRNNFLAWQGLMRLHLADTLSIKDIAEKKTHNIMMIDIASALSYEEFDDVKDYKSTFEMWEKLEEIYGGDNSVRRAKVESLRG